jgi:hypothetical protein
VKYPRPLTRIQQIEPTTFCDLRCHYCPSKDLVRIRNQERMHMTLDTFGRSLEWCQHFARKGTQADLSLTGIGETLLHPDVLQLAVMAREMLPYTPINFSTNGLKLTDELCAHFRDHKIMLFISPHRPEKAAWASERAAKYGILIGNNFGASVSSFDWAGVVKHPVMAPRTVCEWLRDGWGNVLVDGRMTTCCLDSPALGVVGSVWDDIGSLATRPFKLCDTCHMVPPAETKEAA